MLTQTQTQRSANAGDAIFEFVSNDFGTILSMDLLSGDVGIGSNAPSEKLHVAGTALAYNVVRWITKSAAYTASAGDGIFANTTTAAFTVTLPTGALGQVIEVKDNGNNFATNNLTVGSFVLATNGEYAKFVHNGTAWMRL
ncbi:MAG: hypothetical protein COA84_12825 [Robiginitomaculum sp.]|nr:MAG: hypothetical protein COA84_12825 [Robiginitomaculum sp.]